MLVFLDESFRQHRRTGQRFGVLSGVAVPEPLLLSLQAGVYAVRRPYHELVLNEQDEIRGSELLRKATFKSLEMQGFSYQWNLAVELLGYARTSGFRVFAVVCFDPTLHTFRCADEHRIDSTFRYLFARIDAFAKREVPGQLAKLVFDDVQHQANLMNARAITNFLVKSPVGRRYDSILPYPLFAVSQAHNYGLQLADLVATVVALRFQGEGRVQPLWSIIRSMLYRYERDGRRWTSLKLMRQNENESGGRSPSLE